MNWKRVRKIEERISRSLECNLNDGNPCATCTYEIRRDTQKLNDELENFMEED